MLSILYLDIERIYNIIIFLLFPQSLKGVLKIFALSVKFVVTSLEHHHGGEVQVRPGLSLLPPAVVEDCLVENEGEASSTQGEEEEEGFV